MSLTSHLKTPDSPVNHFFKKRLSLTRAVLVEARPLVAQELVVAPPTLEGRRYDYGLVGTAIDYRLRFFFPCSRRRCVAIKGALMLQEMDVLPAEIVQDFRRALVETVKRLAPEQRLLPESDEELLSRFCVLLAAMELTYRCGKISPMLQLAPQTVEQMLQLAQPEMLSDLAGLSRLFWERQAPLTELPSLLNPTFAGSSGVGGADADLVCGTCLVDIKTTKNARLEGAWLHQLLGYALLDWDDKCRLQEVGIYLSRQGVFVRWPLKELLRRLSGKSKSLEAWRAEFRRVVEPLEERRLQERAMMRALYS